MRSQRASTPDSARDAIWPTHPPAVSVFVPHRRMSSPVSSGQSCKLGGILPGLACGSDSQDPPSAKSLGGELRSHSRESSTGKRFVQQRTSANPITVGEHREHRNSRRAMTRDTVKGVSRSASRDSVVDPAARKLAQTLFNISGDITPQPETPSLAYLHSTRSSSGVESCLKPSAEPAPRSLSRRSSAVGALHESRGVQSYFDNEPLEIRSGGIRRGCDANACSFESEGDAVVNSLMTAFRPSRRSCPDSARRCRSSDVEPPWAVTSCNEKSSPSSMHNDDIHIQVPRQRDAHRSSSAQTARKNMSAGPLEDGFSQQQSPRGAHDEALQIQMRRRSSTGATDASSLAAPWAKVSSQCPSSPPPPHENGGAPFATTDGAEQATSEEALLQSTMQRKSRRSLGAQNALCTAAAPFWTEEGNTHTECSLLVPNEVSCDIAAAKTEDEIRIWVTNCMMSHTEAFKQQQRETEVSKCLAGPASEPRAALKPGLRQSTPRHQRKTFDQVAKSAKTESEPDISARVLASAGSRRASGRLSHFPVAFAGSLHTARGGRNTVRSGRHNSHCASTGSLKASTSLSRISRSSSCESLQGREHFLTGSTRLLQSHEASCDMLPSMASVSSVCSEAGGADCGAGLGAGVRHSDDLSGRSIASLIEAHKNSARELGDLLQQNCAERIEQMKSDAHRLDCQRLASQRILEDSLPQKNTLKHSLSRGTTRLDSEISTCGINSQASFAIEADTA